jgi:hypothetical protein
VLTTSLRRGAALLVRVADRGSGVDPSTITAVVDGRYRRVVWEPRRGLVRVGLPGLATGRHTLVLTVSDYQESKNNENGATTLPNTRTLRTAFAVR